jgi:hypothetical protein
VSIRTTIERVADWLAETGYPFDYHFDARPPEAFVDELARAWARRDNETVGSYRIAIAIAIELDDADIRKQRHEEGAG